MQFGDGVLHVAEKVPGLLVLADGVAVLAGHRRCTVGVALTPVEAHVVLASHVGRTIEVITALERAHAIATVVVVVAADQAAVAIAIILAQRSRVAWTGLGVEAAAVIRDTETTGRTRDRKEHRNDKAHTQS